MRTLSKEAIRRVREAEAQAEEIRATAEAQANARIQEMQKTCAAESEEAIAHIDRTLREELERVTEKADELIQQSCHEVQEDIAVMEATAREHMREAVKLIVWEMYDSCQ